MNRAQLGRVLGVSPPTVTRLHQGDYRLDERRKEWELALLVVRLFRGLDSIVGDAVTTAAWMKSYNVALAGRPIELVQSAEGLVRVVHYLDANRALV